MEKFTAHWSWNSVTYCNTFKSCPLINNHSNLESKLMTIKTWTLQTIDLYANFRWLFYPVRLVVDDESLSMMSVCWLSCLRVTTWSPSNRALVLVKTVDTDKALHAASVIAQLLNWTSNKFVSLWTKPDPKIKRSYLITGVCSSRNTSCRA